MENERAPFYDGALNQRHVVLSIVGVRGFEPPTPCSQSRCANRAALHPENTNAKSGQNYMNLPCKSNHSIPDP